MSKSINYETKVKNTKDGSIVFGHIHEDQVKVFSFATWTESKRLHHN